MDNRTFAEKFNDIGTQLTLDQHTEIFKKNAKKTSDFIIDYVDEGIDMDTFDKEAEIAKFKDCEAPLWQVVLRLYTSPEKTKGGVILTAKTREDEQFRTIVGLVVKVSSGAYKDIRYKDTGPACKVGDWVVIARHSGLRMKFNGLPIFCTKEDGIELVVKDPRNVER
jgi:co-chaperonin GroES (HSP10)